MSKDDFLRVDPSAIEPDTVAELDEMDRVFKKAVSEAREDNRRRGIPNFLEQDGQVLEDRSDETARTAGRALETRAELTRKP
jgi:hypothetical protein